MGLFEKIFGKPKKSLEVANYFKTLSAYSPVFTTYDGGIYEMELTRAAVHSFALACSKLKPEMQGSACRQLGKRLAYRPNPWMDTSKFIYRLATIFAVQNNAFIVPIENELGAITGYYPILPQNSEIIDYEGEAYLRYTFASGQRAAIELSRVGILNQYQYKDDFFGEDNKPLFPTMQLIHTQNQGIINGVKNSANVRFLARIANVLKPDDIKKERDRFTEDNLSSDNKSGMIIYDNKFADLKQVDSKPFIINSLQMEQINESVFSYFGTSKKILQNNFNEDEWNAFYEGKIEPFAIQLSLVLSNMTYSQAQLDKGNAIVFSANRLQYASNNTKLNVSTQLFDRGLITRNGVMDIWNMPHVEGGDKFYIRKEYTEVDKLNENGGNNNANEQGTGVQNTNTSANDGIGQ